MRAVIAALAAAALTLPGCGLICRREAIRATLPMPLVAGEDSPHGELAGNLEADRDESAELDRIESAISGGSIGGRGLSMWLQRGLDHTINLSLRLPTPLHEGDVLQVTEVHAADRPFWGTVATSPAGLSVGVQLDSYMATSATGTARVIELDPLRLELDVVTSGVGRELPIRGTLLVRHESLTESCFQ
jgi:hypothetical protein